MRAAIRRSLGIGATVLLLGCAGVDHALIPQRQLPFDASGKATAKAAETRDANVKEDAKFSGVRYYGTSLYLLVYSDGVGNIVWKILELPDQTKKMSARPFNFLARLETQMTFVNGTLDRLTQVVDATVVPRALLEAVAQALPLLAAADAGTYEVPAPELYKIVPTATGFEFVGGPAKEKIKVTVPEGDTR